METITLTKINEVHFKVTCSESVAREINDKFSFFVPNYRFMPAFKFSAWDGKIRLFNLNKKLLYIGLLDDVRKFCKENNYTLECNSSSSEEFSEKEAADFIKSLNTKFSPKEHQFRCFVKSIRSKRGLFLSPTASGKSFIIYLISQYYSDKRKLIIVPTINLVNQISKNFVEYDLNNKIQDDIQIIKGGETKEISKQIVISTWQSLYKQPKKYFDQFDVIIGDEAHLFKSDSLIKIMEKLENCEYRFGFTGTLDGSMTNEMILRGLFGPVSVIATTRELIEKKEIADVKIKCICLKYPEELRKSIKGGSYEDEISWLFANEKRNKFIKNLALSLKGNTLIIFKRVDTHGIPLYEMIKKSTDLPVYSVHGKVKGDEREAIRTIVDTHENSITVASEKTFSTGIDIPNLNNIIFASPSKARITVIQSIGRGLRLAKGKTSYVLFDISDDLSYKKWRNYTLNHYTERLKMYVSEKHPFKEYSVEIK